MSIADMALMSAPATNARSPARSARQRDAGVAGELVQAVAQLVSVVQVERVQRLLPVDA